MVASPREKLKGVADGWQAAQGVVRPAVVVILHPFVRHYPHLVQRLEHGSVVDTSPEGPVLALHVCILRGLAGLYVHEVDARGPRSSPPPHWR